jgi:serine/threonine-protein kinase HipA
VPDYHYRPISEKQLAYIFKVLPKRPLLAGEEGVRLSLAGAQDKIAVRIEGDRISLPLGGAPSTHILKPSIERFAGIVSNEAFTMQLAAETGIPAAKVEVRTAETIEYLSVERYDRKHVKSGTTTSLDRLHQEDFCQALNIVPEMKYQKEGGPSLKQCFALVREVSSAPVVDLARLLDIVIYNYLIGNNDAHGKNFSLLYHEAGTANQEIRLAPLYDAISTVYYPQLSNEMAMKIGDQYKPEKVGPRDFEKLAEQAGLAKPLVRRRVPELAQAIRDTTSKIKTDQEVARKVAILIRKRCGTTLERFVN